MSIGNLQVYPKGKNVSSSKEEGLILWVWHNKKTGKKCKNDILKNIKIIYIIIYSKINIW